jgi:hypothetical protein
LYPFLIKLIESTIEVHEAVEYPISTFSSLYFKKNKYGQYVGVIYFFKQMRIAS